MSSVNNNGQNTNPNVGNNISPNGGVGNGQILYDQYGNPISSGVVHEGQQPPIQGAVANPGVTIQQSTGQPNPQVIKTVQTQGTTNVAYQGNNPVPPQQPHQVPPQDPKKKSGKIRYILLILFFISLLVLVWFLPDLRKIATDRKIASEEEVINGTLKCVYEEEDELLTTLYTSEFKVENNKVKGYTSTVETKGDTGSEEDLNNRNEECELLTKMVKKMTGIKSHCSLNSRKQTSIQEIDYAKINRKNLSAAYSEAGGIMPDYNLDQDAREIKKDMIMARYSCTVN